MSRQSLEIILVSDRCSVFLKWQKNNCTHLRWSSFRKKLKMCVPLDQSPITRAPMHDLIHEVNRKFVFEIQLIIYRNSERFRRVQFTPSHSNST